MGFIASLALESVRRNVIHAFEHHLNTIVPKKTTISGVDVEAQRLARGMLALIKQAYTTEFIFTEVTAILLGYLETSAPSLDELITSSPVEWAPWVRPIITNAVMKLEELSKYDEKTMNLFLLLDDPGIFDFVIIILPIISAHLSQQIRTNVTWLLAADGLREVFGDITPEQKPSKLAEDFVSKDLPILYE